MGIGTNFKMGLIKKYFEKLKKDRENYIYENIPKEINNVLMLGAREDFIQRIHKRCKNIYVVDIKKPTLKSSKIIFIKANLNQKFPFEDGCFDCIIADQLIEHLTNIDNFFIEIKRIAKNKSRIIIGSENLASWHNILALFLGFHPFSIHFSDKYKVGNPLSDGYLGKISAYMSHKRTPTIFSMKDMFGIHNFKIYKFNTFGHLIPYMNIIDKYHCLFFVFILY